jgi:hypothetical protein
MPVADGTSNAGQVATVQCAIEVVDNQEVVGCRFVFRQAQAVDRGILGWRHVRHSSL